MAVAKSGLGNFVRRRQVLDGMSSDKTQRRSNRDGSYLLISSHDTLPLELMDSPAGSHWIAELTKFRNTINNLCHHMGTEADILDVPRIIISNLRKRAINRGQKLPALLQENAGLYKKCLSYKRINAALQTRQTIEKLVMGIPSKRTTEDGEPIIGENGNELFLKASGPRWERLWPDTWEDADTDSDNPFYSMRQEAEGPYDLREYIGHGKRLFSDLSSEIYHLPYANNDGYEHYSPVMRGILRTLRLKLKSGDVDMKAERTKYMET